MKKIVVIILCFVIVFSMTACGNTEKTAASTNPVTETSNLSEEVDASEKETTAVEETVLVDIDQASFKILSMNPQDERGFVLSFLFDNKGDDNLGVAFNNINVNDVMAHPVINLEAGEMIFDMAALAEIGIAEITKIEFTLKIADFRAAVDDSLFNDVITLYPLGEDAVTSYTRIPTQEQMLIEGKYCTASVIGFDLENPEGYVVKVYLHNIGDTMLRFYATEGTSVNGNPCEPAGGETVPAGKHAFIDITLPREFFEGSSITSVETIVLNVKVVDASSWTSPVLYAGGHEIHPW